MAKKIVLITHLGNSGDLDINIPERTTFKLNPYRLSTGVIVGEFEVTEDQLKGIKETDHWKKTYIQLRDAAKGSPERENPANNQVHIGTVINPLGFSMQQVQIIENALLVKPALREILADNVMDACAKILDSEKLPVKSDAPAGTDFKTPTGEEVLTMTVPKLKEAIVKMGGTVVGKPNKTELQNQLQELVEQVNPPSA